MEHRESLKECKGNDQFLRRAYETTRLYRELKMRGAIINDDQLKLLPLEEQYNKVRPGFCLSKG